ncbi:MAG: amidohydrolase [Kangiellaceae bacterium]
MTTLHMRILTSLLILMLVGCSNDRYPDLIIVDTKILTVDQNNSVAEAIAVKDGVIIAVGNSEEIKSLAGSSTKVLSFKQQVLVPGFIAAHEHPTLTAVFADTIDLSGFTFQSSKPMWQHLKQQVAQADKGDWIYAMGLDQVLMPDLILPDKQFLDEIAPNNPLVIVSQTMHSFWANSLAFEQAGISRDTLDPGNGSYYARDQQGELNGFIAESDAASPLLAELKSPLAVVGRYQQTLQSLVEAGFTSVASAGFNIPPMAARYASSDWFEPRIRQFVYLTEDELEHLPDSPSQDNEFYQILGIKLWHDGSPYTGTMALEEPYLHNPITQAMGISEGHKGAPRLSQESFNKLITEFHHAGWQLAVHSQGDYSNELAAETFEKLLGSRSNEQRHRFEHCLLVKQQTLASFKRLGISPSFHINHILYYGDALSEKIIGEQRAQNVLPVKTAFELGLHPTLHADSPMFPADPISLMKTAVMRQTLSGKILGGEQALTPQQALRTVTINGAWQLNMETHIGSFEIGKKADFTLLSGDLYSLDPTQWDNIQVNQVWLAGERKY